MKSDYFENERNILKASLPYKGELRKRLFQVYPDHENKCVVTTNGHTLSVSKVLYGLIPADKRLDFKSLNPENFFKEKYLNIDVGAFPKWDEAAKPFEDCFHVSFKVPDFLKDPTKTTYRNLPTFTVTIDPFSGNIFFGSKGDTQTTETDFSLNLNLLYGYRGNFANIFFIDGRSPAFVSQDSEFNPAQPLDSERPFSVIMPISPGVKTLSVHRFKSPIFQDVEALDIDDEARELGEKIAEDR
jgi:hypothetical protein